MSSPRLLYPLQMLPLWISRKKGNSLKSLMSQHDTVRKQKTTRCCFFFTTGHVTLAYRGNWKGPPCLPRYEAWLWVMWVIPWWQFSIRKEHFHGFLQPLHFVRSKSLLPPDPVTYNVDGFLINRKGIITPLIFHLLCTATFSHPLWCHSTELVEKSWQTILRMKRVQVHFSHSIIIITFINWSRDFRVKPFKNWVSCFG